MNKKIALILLLFVVIALAGAGYMTLHKYQAQRSLAAKAAAVVTVKGLIGSEKAAYFADPQVKRILAEKYQLHIETQNAGSRSIATQGGQQGKADSYDFVFPSGTPAADKIKHDFKTKNSYRVFFTPMAIASWQPVVDVFAKNGLVSKQQNYYRIDMHKLLTLMNDQTRWQDLPNNDQFNVKRRILVKSTDIKSSNSSAMYLSLVSYLANGDDVVINDAQIAQVLPQVRPLFSRQGYMTGSSSTPFEDYLLKGMGDSPLVMIYEAQYLAQARQPDTMRPNMVLLYPEPTIFSQHILLAFSDAGNRLGNVLTTDSELQKLAIQYGFRSNDSKLAGTFAQYLSEHKLNYVPSNFTEVIDPPSYEVLEKMITEIEQQMQ